MCYLIKNIEGKNKKKERKTGFKFKNLLEIFKSFATANTWITISKNRLRIFYLTIFKLTNSVLDIIQK